LLDRSGSMIPLREAVVAGANEFLHQQAQTPGRCRISLAQFDSEDPFALLVDARRIDKVAQLTAVNYEPRAATPLYDAIGALIRRADRRIKKRQRRGRTPEEQIVMIFTDGLENASWEFSRKEIFKLISKRQAAGWTFVFMGANQDAYTTGRELGIPEGNISNWDASDDGARVAQRSVSRALAARRVAPNAAPAASRSEFFGGVREAEEQLEQEQRQG